MMSTSNPTGRVRSGFVSAFDMFGGIQGGAIITGTMLVGLFVLAACSSGAKYFEDAVHDATQATVGKRYGSPHKVQSSADGGETWTYFERGSGTAGFSGQVRRGACQAYVLTFDKQTVLRGWQKQPCEG